MTADTELPRIVLLVTLQESRGGSYAAALEAAGFWVAQSESAEDAVRDIVDLQPDVVVADETVGRTLEAHSAMSAIPLVLVPEPEPLSPPCLRHRVERALAARRVAPQRSDPPARTISAAVESPEDVRQMPRTCPVCAWPLVWAERGSLGGVEYDYYRWCVNGCGLYCLDLSRDQWVKLA